MKADLQQVDRALTPWVVVGGHRFVYLPGSNIMILSACQKPDHEVNMPKFEVIVFMPCSGIGIAGVNSKTDQKSHAKDGFLIQLFSFLPTFISFVSPGQSATALLQGQAVRSLP